MGSKILHRTFRMAVWLLMPVCGAVAQGLPQGPKHEPLPHPDVAPPSIPGPGLPLWLVIGVITLAVLLVALVLWFAFRKTVRPPALPPPPLTQALKGLQALLLESDSVPPEETAHQVSVVLRHYQQRRYLVPAPYRTREELYDQGEFNVRGPAPARFKPIALLSDQLAFASVPATKKEARELVQQSIDALQQESYHVAESPKTPPPLPSAPLPPPPSIPPPPVIPPLSSATPPPLPDKVSPSASP
jgi:hypothetical protein